MTSIKKNFLYNTLYQLLAILIPLVTTPYLSRTLTASGIGTYSYYYSIANYFVIFIMLGLNNYGNRTIAKARDNAVNLSKTFWSIYFLQFILGLLFNLLYLVYCIFLSENWLISFAMWFYVLSATFDVNWAFFGLEKFKLTVIRNSVIKIISTIFIFVLVKSSNDVFLYSTIMTVGLLASQLALWPYILKNIPFYVPRIKEIAVHIKPNLFLFITVIFVSIFKIMDKIMLGMMTTTAQVGFYESSEKIIAIPTALITSLGTVMLPRMSNMVAKNEQSSNQLIYMSILFAMFVSSSLCFGIMAVSKEFVPIFYGPGYETCIDLFLILLPSCLFMAFANVIRTQYLLPHQMDTAYVISAILGAIVNLTINTLLIPVYGAVGAALGTLVAEAIVCFYQVYQVRKVQPILLYVSKSIPFILSGLIMFVILFNVSIPIESNIIQLVAKIVIGVAIYFIALFIQMILFRFLLKKIYMI